MIVCTWSKVLVLVFLKEAKKFTEGYRWWYLSDASTCWIKFVACIQNALVWSIGMYVLWLKISRLNSSLLYAAYQVHAVKSTCSRHVCLIVPLTRAVVSNRNLDISPRRQWPTSSVEHLVAALGLVHSIVVQIACAKLRNRHAWMFFICASLCINGC